MATTKRRRGWKYDRMLALKLIDPDIVRGIAMHKFQSHLFDTRVCEFFGLQPNHDHFESLRPTAREVMGAGVTAYEPFAGRWTALAIKIEETLP